MGKKKSKSSRKGKKEWRANISVEDIDDFFEKSTKDAHSGGSLADVPSDSLFYVDKSRDLSVRRKIEKHREKVLHADSVLAKNPFVQTIPTSKQRESKKQKKSIKLPTIAEQDSSKDDGGLKDLWNGEPVKSKKKPRRCIIPAVEIDSAGCSFNPDSEYHQDSLASAVADELGKVYRAELAPAPIPAVATEDVDEEDMLFLEADAGSYEGDEDEAIPKDYEGDVDQRVGKAKKRVTRVELNRRARRKECLKAEAASMKVKKLASEIDSLPNIVEEIKKEDEEKDKKHLRRVIAKQERLKVRPPRIGRQKFQPAPVQVLLSEEITGSLRQLKGCPTLARDRFKSLEKRGLVIPSKKSGRSGKRIGSQKIKIMRVLAARLATYLRAAKTNPVVNAQSRRHCSSFRGADEKALEDEAERRIGLFFKVLFAGTATFVAYQFFPYMGLNLMQQSVSLLHVKDPLFKRMGASRLARFAVDEENRMKILEMGGDKELLNMLETAKDDPTRKEALKALDAISNSDEAVWSLQKAGAMAVITALPSSLDSSSNDEEMEKYKLSLLNRFEDK